MIKVIKVNEDTHKGLRIFQMNNYCKTIDEAIVKLLQISANK